jgi:hypothetical protein
VPSRNIWVIATHHRFARLSKGREAQLWLRFLPFSPHHPLRSLLLSGSLLQSSSIVKISQTIEAHQDLGLKPAK